MKSNIYFIIMILPMLLMLISCKEEKITITKDYVINPNWDEFDNALMVYKVNLKDSSNDINLKNVSPPELLRKLEKDTGFSFVANVKYNGEKYSKRKVYFNRKNGFSWGKLDDINYEQEILGELERSTWYLLAGLSEVKTLYYVYIDSLDSLHTYRVPASYWTNY